MHIPPRLLAQLLSLWLVLQPAVVTAAEVAGNTAGDWRVGPVYAAQFPRLEVVIETPLKLTAEQLTLLEDGRATATASSLRPFREIGQGLALALALDVSGTMAGAPLTAMKSALSAFLPQLRPIDRAALVTFADTWQEEAAFGAPVETLKTKVQTLKVRGSRTELYRGIFQALRLFNKADELPTRKRLLVISDGHNEAEGYTLENVIRLAQEQQIPVDAVGLSRDSNSPHLSNLEKLAELTGGTYAKAERVEDLERIFRAGIERLQETPVASFTAQVLTGDGQQHRLGVRLNTAVRATSAEVSLWLPKHPQTAPTMAPAPATNFQAVWQNRRLRYWLLGACGLLALLALSLWLARRRRSRRRKAVEVGPSAEPAAPLNEPLPSATVPVAPLEIPLAAFNPPPASNNTDAYLTVPTTDRLARPTGAETEAVLDTVEEPVIAPVVEPSSRRFANVPTTVPLYTQPPGQRQRSRTKVHTDFRPPAPGQPTALLVAEEGWEAGKTFAIECSPFWIGAETENALFIADDTFLSSYHACIEFRDGNLWLHDNASTNGTFLNEQRVQTTPRPLSEGDRIKLGGSVFVLKRARAGEELNAR